mmetsp:Transcript_35805/g.58614  ORF Transcript_35805/g.58614 Transcript_35805/m.58614 type:complete len:340 (-) Transcript_35805:63-1082(-)
MFSTGILPGATGCQSTHHGLDLGGLELKGTLRCVSRIRIQHARGCGGGTATAAKGTQLDTPTVLAGGHVHWSGDLLASDDLGGGGALRGAVGARQVAARLSFTRRGVTLAVAVEARRIARSQSQRTHCLLFLPVVDRQLHRTGVQVGQDIVILPKHIQHAGLGTEGTEGEAQATLKLHGAVDTLGCAAKTPVALIDAPGSVVSFGSLVVLVQVSHDLCTINGDGFHFLVDLMKALDVLWIHDVATSLVHICAGGREKVEARVARPSGLHICIMVQCQGACWHPLLLRPRLSGQKGKTTTANDGEKHAADQRFDWVRSHHFANLFEEALQTALHCAESHG